MCVESGPTQRQCRSGPEALDAGTWSLVPSSPGARPALALTVTWLCSIGFPLRRGNPMCVSKSIGKGELIELPRMISHVSEHASLVLVAIRQAVADGFVGSAWHAFGNSSEANEPTWNSPGGPRNNFVECPCWAQHRVCIFFWRTAIIATTPAIFVNLICHARIY